MKRHYDVDWIRVLATLAVFIYHCLMFFNPWAWHVKNNVTDPTYITTVSLFMSSWLMPIFFVMSGMSSFYALNKRSGKEYIRDRLARLGIPLLFGVMILTPPQVYMERISHGQFSGSFFQWFPHYFDGVYLDIGGTGNFAFVGLHLWYLFVLLIFSLITLPLFLKKKPATTKELKPYQYYLLAIPLMILSTLVDVVRLGGWDITFYLVLFLYGYFIFTKESFRKMVHKILPLNLVIAVLTTIYFIYGFFSGMPSDQSIVGMVFASVKALNCWTWVLVILSFADRYLSFTNKWLTYGSRASMPFYVLHQPVIVTLGFFLAGVEWSIPVKLLLLIVVSFLIIMSIYQYIISKISIFSVLFGIKGNRTRFERKSNPGIKVNR